MLSLFQIGFLARMTRSAMLDVLEPGFHPHRACQGR